MSTWPMVGCSRRAHPRRCGADKEHRGEDAGDGGSSPQLRGRFRKLKAKAPTNGLIPAGAGQIPATRIHGTNSWAHPRRCGADALYSRPPTVKLGSSPQVRGRCHLGNDVAGFAGLIPAGAGQMRKGWCTPTL